MQARVWVGVMCNVTAPIRFVASIFRWSCDQILQFAPALSPVSCACRRNNVFPYSFSIDPAAIVLPDK